MGMDVYGISGNYFRNNCWWWRPLWDYCKDVNDHYKVNLIDDELYRAGHQNNGAGLGHKESKELANLLQNTIDNGQCERYITARDRQLESIPDEPCIRFNNNNRGYNKKKDCNTCKGSGTQESWDKNYPLDVANVKEFIKFLKESDGFEIC